MQKKFGIVVVAAIQVPGSAQQTRPGVGKASRRRLAPTQQASVPTAA